MPVRKLSAADLRLELPLEKVARLRSTNQHSEIIGQERALRALEMGIDMSSEGYNIFVAGSIGTGRQTATEHILHNRNKDMSHLRDIAFVYNFQAPENPRPLYFKAGRAESFKREIHDLVEQIKSLLQYNQDSPSFKQKRDKIIAEIEQQENSILSDFEARLAQDNFKIVSIERESEKTADIIPLLDDQESDFDQLQKLVKQGQLPADYWNKVREQYYAYMDELKDIYAALQMAREDMEEEIANLQRDALFPFLGKEIRKFEKKYREKEIQSYLKELEADIKDNLFLFTIEGLSLEQKVPPLIRYGVNVLINHKHSKTAPVIFANHPNIQNLCGHIDVKYENSGESYSTFMLIRPGQLIKASGGFLIMRAEDVLKEEDAWVFLKRVMQSSEVEISMSSNPFAAAAQQIKPEAVKIKLKIILIGSDNLYDILYQEDEDFQKLFKVLAEFDSIMPRSDENTAQYLQLIDRIVKNEKMSPFDDSACVEIIRYGIGLCEKRNCLSTRFSVLADIIRESNYWAGKLGQKTVSSEAVKNAMRERTYRLSLPEEKIDEEIRQGNLLLQLEGEEIGVVNGLAVIDRGYYSFGRPIVITAQVAPGDQGVINIEREAGLSGEIHDKGMLIIESFLRSRYARHFALSITAGICFEQSYSYVDGDSASSSEIYALLSAIAGLPLRQDIAVTGSVNQMGKIQPVGGISEKIEGFYHVCKMMGLNGSQGVIIPRLNENNLILNDEILQAVEKGEFHIYTVSSIDQGMEILSGLEAGIENKDGSFTKNSINYMVEKNLKELSRSVKST